MVDFLRACWKDHLFQEQHLSRNSAHVVLQLFLWLQDPATLQTKQKCLGNGYFMGKSMVSRVSLPIRSQVAKFTIFTTSLPSCTAYVLIFRFPATLTCGAWGGPNWSVFPIDHGDHGCCLGAQPSRPSKS